MARNCWLLLLILLITSFQIQNSTSAPTFFANICPNTTTFANNSNYQSNLNTVFRSLSSNATNPTGFSTASAGNATTGAAVYGLSLCRGDQNVSSCQDCVTTATIKDLPQKCPNRKVAIIWYDECMVRYSNESFFGQMDQAPSVRGLNTQNITGNLTLFSDILGNMMNDISIRAANEESGKKFATEIASYTSLQTIYGLGQCTPDLTESDCNMCLRIAIGKLGDSVGERVLLPSCNVRYEDYPFFNGAATNQSLVSPPPTTGMSPSSGGKKKISAKVIIAIVAPVTAVALLVIGVCLIINKRAKKYDAAVVDETGVGEDFTTIESLQYDLATLQSATNNFSEENKLGEGGFGGVYKGTLPNGQEIGVKRLSRSSGQGIEEFKNEILLVAKLQHRNLVRLLGYCLGGEEKLLIYEYVQNKSLDHFIFDLEKQGQLDWGNRYKIIGGIARGMLYLHHDSQLRIIHRDLKASNVLLDANMNAKISDFGMARIFVTDQTQGNTSRVVGTYGYMSPEYAMHGQFSVKSDVYSFGVLVLEIISGKRNSTFYEFGYAEDLLSYAWKLWRDGMPFDFVDPTIRDSCSSNEIIRCIHLGLLCVQESIDERPTMATVVLMLDSYTVTLPVPEQPAFFTKSRVESNFAKEIGSDQSSTKSLLHSLNDVSITEPEPR